MPEPTPEIEIRDLGLVAYHEAYALQREILDRKRWDPSLPDTLLLLEHPEVYTAGRKSALKEGDGKVAIERGGEDTFHNPGQLVAYPLLGLREGERDLHRYLRSLESVLIAVLGRFGIEGERRPGATGVWVRGPRKIASVGVAVSGWVTYHGVALNVCNDLRGFSRIHPCGFDAGVMTSMAEVLGDHRPSVADVKQAFQECFLNEFSREPVALRGPALLG